jgi:hypothetical protein
MYYRVAIQVDAAPTCQWKSTVLSSLDAVFRFLRLYQALPHDRLCVFSCSSREEMHEQLGRVNTGLSSTSVTAAQFLQERLIHAPGVRRGASACEGGAYQQRASNAIATRPAVQIRSREGNSLVGRDMSPLDRRRLELELGPSVDHDVTYRFVLPPSMPQVLVWVKLLAKVAYGDLQP